MKFRQFSLPEHRGNSHARNWLCARRVHKPVLAYTKKRAPKFSILQALVDGDFSNVYFFLPAIANRSEEINQYLNKISISLPY